MTKILFIFFFLLLFLSGCFSQNLKNNPIENYKKLETLSNITIKESQVNIRVTSTGCTNSNNFVINNEIVDHQCKLSIYRIKPDLCKRATHYIDINLSWDKTSACGSNKTFVSNPRSKQNAVTF